MALFKFRLAPVLRYRERLKEEKEWELRALLEFFFCDCHGGVLCVDGLRATG